MAAMDQLQRTAARRVETDYQMDYAIHLLLTVLTCLLWSLVTVYRLVKRRDLHLVRSADFAADTLAAVRERADALGKRPLVEGHLGTMDVVARDLRTQARERGAALWTLLSAITGGLAYFFIANFLHEDYRRHEQTETEFSTQLGETLRLLGLPAGTTGFQPQMSDQSFPLYLLLSIFTCGLFGFYWAYRLNDEENRHMRAHAAWEPEVLGLLGAAAAAQTS